MAGIKIHSANLYEVMPEYLQIYRQHPLLWYTERFGGLQEHLVWSDLPGYENHQWDGTPDPLAKVFSNMSKGIPTAVEAATSVGKTYLFSVIAYWFLDVYRGGTVTCVGNSYDDLKDTLWPEIKTKFNIFKKFVPTAKMYDSGQIVCDKDNLEDSKWTLRLKGTQKKTGRASSGSIQGRHNKYMLFLLDEAAHIDPSVFTAVDNTSTDRRHNLMLAAGNPDSRSDALHQFSLLPYVDAIRISAYDFPNVKFKKEIIPGGAVSYQSVVDRLDAHGATSPLFLSRVRGISPQDSSFSLIKFSDLERCKNFTPEYQEPDTYMGIDVANSQDGDEAAVFVMDGQIITYGKSFASPNANMIATNIALPRHELEQLVRDNPNLPIYDLPSIYDYPYLTSNRIGVDSTGVGVGTVNEFLSRGLQVYSFVAGGTVTNSPDLQDLIPIREDTLMPAFQFADVRSLAFWLLRKDITEANIGFAPDFPEDTFRQLQLELSIFYLKPDAKVWRLAPKHDLKKKLVHGKSPNLADALVICNFMRHLTNGYNFASYAGYET